MGLATERGGLPVPEEGQFPLNKGGRKGQKMVTTIRCMFDSPWEKAPSPEEPLEPKTGTARTQKTTAAEKHYGLIVFLIQQKASLGCLGPKTKDTQHENNHFRISSVLCSHLGAQRRVGDFSLLFFQPLTKWRPPKKSCKTKQETTANQIKKGNKERS